MKPARYVRFLLRPAILLTLASCTFVSDDEVNAKFATDDMDGGQASSDCDDTDPQGGVGEAWYLDGDGDSYGDLAAPSAVTVCPGTSGPEGYVPNGSDCDDEDAAVHPGLTEIWYDGTDQDCDGNDGDQDGDGYYLDAYVGEVPSGFGAGDCGDLDGSVYPHAEDTWYDGLDQNCDGASDFDMDGDGHDAAAYGGGDCDDTDSAVSPDAIETWYDGVDADCAGDDDFDQDLDGYLAAGSGGDDCDDADPSAHPGGTETLDDDADGDCDGEADRPVFQSLDTHAGTGLRGPRLAEMSGYTIVAWMADSFVYGGADMTTGGVVHLVDTLDPLGGAVSDSGWEWGDAYTLDQGFAFWADDDAWVWAYGLRASTTRYLVVDVYDVAGASWGNSVYSRSTSATFDDVEMLEDTDGTLHAVGCEDGAGYLTWVHGAAAGLHAGTVLGGDDTSGASGDACAVWPPTEQIFVSRRASSAMGVYAYDDTSGLSSFGTSPTWNVYDYESDVASGGEAMGAAEGTEGAWAYLDGADADLAVSDARTVGVALDSRGQMYMVVGDGGGAAWLFWGDPGGGFASLELPTGLTSADDVDVFVASGDTVFLAVRGGDDVVYTALNAR